MLIMMESTNARPLFHPSGVVVTKNDSIFECKVGNGLRELTISINKPTALKYFYELAKDSIPISKMNDVDRNPNHTAIANDHGEIEQNGVKASQKSVDGVICMVDDEFCYVYWKGSIYELSIPRTLTEKERIRKGNWLRMSLEETAEGVAILDFAKIDDRFKTMPLSDTVLVQAQVDVPSFWNTNFDADTAMTSDISINVFDRNSLLHEDHKGKRVTAILRYSYSLGDICGVWIIANVLDYQ